MEIGDVVIKGYCLNVLSVQIWTLGSGGSFQFLLQSMVDIRVLSKSSCLHLCPEAWKILDYYIWLKITSINVIPNVSFVLFFSTHNPGNWSQLSNWRNSKPTILSWHELGGQSSEVAVFSTEQVTERGSVLVLSLYANR